MKDTLVSLTKQWLDNNNVHLATHHDAGYHYLNPNEFDYSGYSSYEGCIENAIEDGSVYVDGENCLHICGEVIEL